MLKRKRAASGSCEGCFFYLSDFKKGESPCSKPVRPTYAGIDCVVYDVADPNQFVYYIFVEDNNDTAASSI